MKRSSHLLAPRQHAICAGSRDPMSCNALVPAPPEPLDTAGRAQRG